MARCASCTSSQVEAAWSRDRGRRARRRARRARAPRPTRRARHSPSTGASTRGCRRWSDRRSLPRHDATARRLGGCAGCSIASPPTSSSRTADGPRRSVRSRCGARHGRRVWQRILDFPDQTWRGARLRYWRVVARRSMPRSCSATALAIEMARLRFPGPVWTSPNARTRNDSTPRSRRAAARLRAELGLPADERVVGSSVISYRRSNPSSRSTRSPRCTRRLRRAISSSSGDGPLARSRATGRRLGLSRSVTLLGHRDDTEWLYGGGDLAAAHERVRRSARRRHRGADVRVPGRQFSGRLGGRRRGRRSDRCRRRPIGRRSSRRATHELLADEPCDSRWASRDGTRSADYSTSRTARDVRPLAQPRGRSAPSVTPAPNSPRRDNISCRSAALRVFVRTEIPLNRKLSQGPLATIRRG